MPFSLDPGCDFGVPEGIQLPISVAQKPNNEGSSDGPYHSPYHIPPASSVEFPYSNPSQNQQNKEINNFATLSTGLKENTNQLATSELKELKNVSLAMLHHMESTLQSRVNTEREPLPSPQNGQSGSRASYCCKLCQFGERNIYTNVGPLRRHIMSVHLTYSCPCGFISHRKDKLKDHCRSHEHKANPLHRECIICSNPVKSQQEYFQCIIEHCRLPEQYHSETGVLTSQVAGADFDICFKWL
ncbi:hypothetical protein M432DRAFT_153703 [Thermoascus aurantiacus ATCC 26904]